MEWTRHALLIALLAAASLALTNKNRESTFPDATELVYSLRLDVSSGVNDPQIAISYYAAKAKLTVTSGESVFFKLDDVTYTAYNGEGTIEKKPVEQPSFIPPAEDSRDLLRPFSATFDHGKVLKIEFESEDAVWSRNMKRAIVDKFQLDLADLKTSIYEEAGIYGGCSVSCTVTPVTGDSVTVRKFIDHSTCRHEKEDLDDDLLKCRIKEQTQNTISGSTERKYNLRRVDGTLVVDHLLSRSIISLQSWGEQGDLQFLLTNQTLKLEKMSPVTSRPSLSDPESSTSLTTEHPDDDAGFSRQFKTQEEIAKRVLFFLNMAVDRMSIKEVTPALMHDISLNHALMFIRRLDAQFLHQLADSVLQGTLYRDESIRQSFLNILAQAGTEAAVKVVIELTMELKFKVEELKYLIRELPFHLRRPAPTLLKTANLDSLLNLPEELAVTGILTYGSLVGRACAKNNCLQSDEKEKAKPLLETLSSASSSFESKMVAMEALGNMATKTTVADLEPIIRGEGNFTHELRYLAVWAAQTILSQDPKQVHRMFWPILINEEETLDMRSAAVTMLLETGISKETFTNLYWYMKQDVDSRLYHFYLTSVKSLLQETQPCYVKLPKDVIPLARLLPDSDFEDDFTGNHVLSLDDNTYSGIQFVALGGDEDADTPEVIFARIYDNKFGVSEELSIHLRLVMGDTKESKTKNKPDTTKSDKMKILNSLNITFENDEGGSWQGKKAKPHIEIIVRKKGLAMEVKYFEDSSFLNADELLGFFKVMDYSKQYFHYYEETVRQDFLMANDAGIETVVTQYQPISFDFLGNNSAHFFFSVDVRSRLIARLRERTVYGIFSYNPFGSMYHGVHRSTTIELFFPFSARFTVSGSDELTAQLTFDWDPKQTLFTSAAHSKTDTFIGAMLADETLKLTCPKCKKFNEVSVNDNKEGNQNIFRFKYLSSEFETSLDIFDCDDRNYASKVNLIMTLYDYIAEDKFEYPKGTCGVKFESKPVGDVTKAQFTLKMAQNKSLDEDLVIVGKFSLLDSNSVAVKQWRNEIHKSETKSAIDIFVKSNAAQDENKFVTCTKVVSDKLHPILTWDGLYNPDSPLLSHSLNFSVKFGNTTSFECSEAESEISMISRFKSEPVANSSWYDECVAERKGDIFPATENCGKAAIHGSIYDDFYFEVSQKNLPEDYKRSVSRITELLHTFMPSRVPKEMADNFSLHVFNEDDVNLDVTYKAGDSDAVNYKWQLDDDFHLNDIRKKLSPLIDDLQEQEFLGLAGECFVAGSQLLTFDNKSIPFPSTSKYVLLAGDCSGGEPKFVILGRLNQDNILEMKLHFKNEMIDIVEKKMTIIETRVPTASEWSDSSSEPTESEKTTKIVRREPVLTIYNDFVSKVSVRHSSKYVQIVVSDVYDEDVCGLCGDFDGTQESLDDFPKAGVNINDNLIDAFTVNDD